MQTQFRVVIEVGNENVANALDTTVVDGELLITFLEGDVITFRAIKVRKAGRQIICVLHSTACSSN